MKRVPAFVFLLLLASLDQARSPEADYALILGDQPVAQKSQSRAELHNAAVQAQLQRIRTAQNSVIFELKQRNVPVTGAVQILANAVFVRTTSETALSLGGIPGVAHVQYLPPVRRDLNTALGQVNVPAAVTALGGPSNAGAGVKIGIIDTGIDQNHAGFQDGALTPPAGFPKGDTNYTNKKVIVARSYVAQLSDTDPNYSTPDDTTPRDRVGHGTAIAMIAAGVLNTGPVAAIQGVAPKAFLGNYKIFGSPGVNDFSSQAVVQAALQDAFTDGMDIVTLSLNEGDPVRCSVLDVNSADCGAFVDIQGQAVETAVANGMVVVTSAGNDGNAGQHTVTLSTIHTPGTAPSSITVGASTNAHLLFQAVHVTRSGAPAALQNIYALFGDGPHIASPLAAPVTDVTTLGNDGLACSALPAGSLSGAIALVQRGTCVFADKINNAQNAGAIGVILYQSAGIDTIYNSLGARNTGIPAVMIGYTDGTALKSYVHANSGTTASLDPTWAAVNSQPNTVAAFSSRGPSPGSFSNPPTFAIKPELVAVGDNIYTTAQKLDPNGDTYDASGYTTVSGTSYSVGMVAGAVALVKQKNPSWTPAQLKSAVVNTATGDVVDIDGTLPARVGAVGAGKLSALDAINATATINPPTIGFGAIAAASLPINRTLTVTNARAAATTFSFSVQPRDAETTAHVAVSPSTLTLSPGQQNSVTVGLTGSRPAAGNYEGFIVVTGTGSTLRVPYSYQVGSGIPYDMFSILDGSFIGAPNDTRWLLAFRLMDQYGVPVMGTPVLFSTFAGGGTITSGDANTANLGIAAAYANLGSSAGDQIFKATAGGLTVQFDGYARPLPTIAANGVGNAAPGQPGLGLAPGSYISIYGANLSDTVAVVSTPALPVSLASVSVSFDDGGLSLPGHLHFVSPGQVNVQIPWEFQGHSSVQMKVTLSPFLWGNVYTLNLATYSPAVFPVGANAAALDTNYALITPSHPATRGQAIQIYVNGLGPVDNQPPSGEQTPLTLPYATTKVNPTAKIGGVDAPVIFSGLAPGIVGLYQVNVIVPQNAPTGNQSLIVSIGGVSSPAINLPVQ